MTHLFLFAPHSLALLVYYVGIYSFARGGRRGYSWEFLVGVCPVLQILTLFQTQKCHFPQPFSDQTSKTAFSDLEEVTKRNMHVYKDRNYIIITEIRAPTKRFLNNSFRIHTLWVYFLFIWNQSTNMSVHHRSSLENYIQTKMAYIRE